jgi:hypothetical protein
MNKGVAGGILIGIGIGTYLPTFTFPLSVLNKYIGVILIIIGLIILIKSK